VRKRGPHDIDLAHAFPRNRLRPLLVGQVFERPRKDVAGGIRNSVEWADTGKELLEAFHI
jgi:hypothetical protein